MADQSPLVKVVTPVGELHYVQIDGKGKEKYDKEKGNEYVATLYLSSEASEPLRQKMDEVVGEIKKGESLKSKGYRQLMKDKDGKVFTPTNKNKERQEDAELIDMYGFTFKTSTVFKEKDGATKPKIIGVYDAGNKTLKIAPKKITLGGKKIGNGSLGAISGTLQRSVYKGEVSCSLYLNSIQLINFIEYDGDAGFEAQDDGYEGTSPDDNDNGDFSAQSDVSGGESEGAAEQPKSKPRI